MTPLESLLDYYGRHGMADQLWPHMAWCAEHGACVLSPGACVLAKPVRHEWTLDEVLAWRTDIELTLNPDTWHVLYAAGSLRRILAAAPYPLPWVSYQRRGGALRLRKWEQLQHAHGIFQTKDA